MQRLIIRADGDLRTGTGHVMRCLALAQGWKDRGGTVTFFTHATLPLALEQRLRDEGIVVVTHQHAPGSREDAEALCALAGTDAVVVADGYVFGADYQRTIKAAGLPLLFIDDNGHADHYAADWVLNQNIHAHESLYANREPNTRLLLGTRYALLRREFWRWRGWQREFREPATNLLITLGGSDADNVTLKVLEAVAQMPDAEILQVKAVIGGGNPHLAELQAFAAASPLQIDILHNVTDMPEIMAWADMAVTAGGSTVWELCLMGLSSLTITLADNQAEIVTGMAQCGATIDIGWGHDIIPVRIESRIAALFASREERSGMSATLKTLVDGYGVERVIQFILGVKAP